MRNYFVQIILVILTISNKAWVRWENSDVTIPFACSSDFPIYQHYWYIYAHEVQFFGYLAIIATLLFTEIEIKYKHYAGYCVLLYIAIDLYDFFEYLTFDGMELNFKAQMTIFVVGMGILGIVSKVWKN